MGGPNEKTGRQEMQAVRNMLSGKLTAFGRLAYIEINQIFLKLDNKFVTNETFFLLFFPLFLPLFSIIPSFSFIFHNSPGPVSHRKRVILVIVLPIDIRDCPFPL